MTALVCSNVLPDTAGPKARYVHITWSTNLVAHGVERTVGSDEVKRLSSRRLHMADTITWGNITHFGLNDPRLDEIETLLYYSD